MRVKSSGEPQPSWGCARHSGSPDVQHLNTKIASTLPFFQVVATLIGYRDGKDGRSARLRSRDDLNRRSVCKGRFVVGSVQKAMSGGKSLAAGEL